MMTRRGIGLVELLVAVVMLTVLLAILAQLLGVLAAQRRRSARRQLATEAVANAMERLAALEYAELEPQLVRQVQLPRDVQRSLPAARLTVEVTPEATQPASKRIQVELSWQNRAGQTNRPVRLTAWRYAP
jgi:type II secretory pathway pseudopilin PulG